MTYDFTGGGSPDVTFRYDSDIGFIGWYGGSPSPSANAHPIAIGETLLFSDVWKENSPGLPSDYVSDETCFEAEVNLINIYDETDIQDIIFVNEEPIPSNNESVFPRGIQLDLRSKQVISYLNIDRYHHDWGDPITSNDEHLLEVNHTPDGEITINNNFYDGANSTLSTSTSDIPISIQDPWYVDGNGDQLNDFHELNEQENPGGSYDLFLDESEISGDPNTALYAVSVLHHEITIGSDRYIFDGWDVTGALLAPYPGEESNELKKKALFETENATITARYLNLSALSGNIKMDHTLNGTINIVGNVTINSGADVTLETGTTVNVNQYKWFYVYGTLTANGAYFTRSDPNNTSRNYWKGIKGNQGSTVLLTNCTVEGALYGLYGYSANVRAINTTFNRNTYGMYFSNCNTNYSHDNLITDNTYGVFMWGSNIPLHNNTISNSVYIGIFALNTSGAVTNNTIIDNGTNGVQASYYTTIALKDCDYGGQQPVNNVITGNGNYGVYIDYNSTPDLGTYFVNYRGWTYGGYNTFNSSTGNADIRNYNSSTVYAQMNWWETKETIGNIFTLPEAGGIGPLPKTMTSDFSMDSLQLAEVMVADSLYADALIVYRQLLSQYPDYQETALVIGKIMETYRIANQDIQTQSQYNDNALITELETIYANHGTSLAGLISYDHSIAVKGMIGEIVEAIDRCDDIISLYANMDTTYSENIAYVMYEQGQLLESLPDTLNGQGKLRAFPNPVTVYQRILDEYPNSKAAELVRMGRIETGYDGEEEHMAESFTLYPAYPNPFNPNITIPYALQDLSTIVIHVYDITGRRVNTLKNEIQDAGYHKISWDGTNMANKPLSSGMYIIQLTVKTIEEGKLFTKAEKVVLIK